MACAACGFIFQMYNLIPVLTAYQERRATAVTDKAEGSSASSMWRQRYLWSDWPTE